MTNLYMVSLFYRHTRGMGVTNEHCLLEMLRMDVLCVHFCIVALLKGHSVCTVTLVIHASTLQVNKIRFAPYNTGYTGYTARLTTSN